MSYATLNDLVIAFGARELSEVATPKRFEIPSDEDLELAAEDPTGYPAGKPNQAALEAVLDALNHALAVADGIIDSYLATRYSLPLASTPIALTEKALDLARFELQRERASEEAKTRREFAIAWLKDLAAGRAKLGSVALDGAEGGSGIAVQSSAGRVFTDETLESFTL